MKCWIFILIFIVIIISISLGIGLGYGIYESFTDLPGSLEKYHMRIFNPETRIQYYLGPVGKKKFIISPQTKFYGNPILIDENIMNFISDDPYIIEMKTYYSTVRNKGYRYLFIPGDVRHTDVKVPQLAKTRPLDVKGANVLLPLNLPRHWEPLQELVYDIPWKEKRDLLVWRGANTGRDKRVGVERYIDVPWGDLGFINMFNGEYKGHKSSMYIKPRMEIRDMLKYRYLLSIEGNDVASNLKWILASNSVCLMPKPTMESWLMEGKLIPWVHYIPVRRDLKDLPEKVQWAQTHQRECIKIVHNANEYMSYFKVPEANIVKNILDIYGQTVKVKYH